MTWESRNCPVRLRGSLCLALSPSLSFFLSLSLSPSLSIFFFFTGNAFFLKVSRRRQAAQCSQTAVARRNLRRF